MHSNAPRLYRLTHHSADDWPDHIEVPDRKLTYVSHHVTKREPDECWLYNNGRCNPTLGYPVIEWRIHKRRHTMMASRLVLTIALDRPIRPGMYALHRCNNSLCCNPGHIYEGTHRDNRHDRMKLISDLRAGNVVPFASAWDRASYPHRLATAA